MLSSLIRRESLLTLDEYGDCKNFVATRAIKSQKLSNEFATLNVGIPKEYVDVLTAYYTVFYKWRYEYWHTCDEFKQTDYSGGDVIARWLDPYYKHLAVVAYTKLVKREDAVELEKCIEMCAKFNVLNRMEFHNHSRYTCTTAANIRM
jgi:hypothetical protein